MKKVVSFFVVLSVLVSSVFFRGGTKVFAMTDEDLLNAEEQLGAYIFYEDGKPFINIEKVKTDRLEEEYIEISLMVNQISNSYASYQTNTTMNTKKGIPIWGNLCGPGHGSGPPQDILDRGCQIHDKCYEEKGYFSCSCDWELVAYIDRNFHRMGLKEKIAAAAIKLFFNKTLCNPLK